MKNAEQIAQGHASRARILAFIDSYMQREGWSPSYREIAEGVELPVSCVHKHIHRLVAQGRLETGGRGQLRISRR